MRRIWMGVALLLVAHASFAAIQYEFIQTSRSDSDVNPSTDFTARAVIDGMRTRVDFISGNAYPPGTYAISNDSLRKLIFVDPTQKSYTELNTMAIASQIGTSNIVISDFKSIVTKLDDRRQIAGYTADHYRLTMTYDITVTKKSRPLKQSARIVIDKWTTLQFGEIGTGMDGRLMQTGNAQIDELISTEFTKIRGFPLKQTIQVTTMSPPRKPVPGSQLNIPATRTLTREVTVTAIRQAPTNESVFIVPAEYRLVDFAAQQPPKSQMQVLSMEPASK
jgi:hypothetical protein